MTTNRIFNFGDSYISEKDLAAMEAAAAHEEELLREIYEKVDAAEEKIAAEAAKFAKIGEVEFDEFDPMDSFDYTDEEIEMYSAWSDACIAEEYM